MHYSQILAALAATGALAAVVPLQARSIGDVEALDKRFENLAWSDAKKRGDLTAGQIEASSKRFCLSFLTGGPR
jgi:hypothetical protein